jgi:hypothetical protein
MSETKAYPVQERINAMIDDEVEAALRALQPIKSQFTLAGAYNGSRRILIENESLRKSFQSALAKMAKLIYHAVGQTPEGTNLLKVGARSMETRFAAHAPKAQGHDLNGRLLREFTEKLDVDVKKAITDFGFGLAGDETLKKDSGTVVTNVMHDSPGASQAAGGRDVHQKVVHHIYAPLIQQLEELSGTEAFKQLDAEKQEEVGDLVESVREAAIVAEPDPKKVERRTNRLMKQLDDFGLQVAANAVGAILVQVLSGG